ARQSCRAVCDGGGPDGGAFLPPDVPRRDDSFDQRTRGRLPVSRSVRRGIASSRHGSRRVHCRGGSTLLMSMFGPRTRTLPPRPPAEARTAIVVIVLISSLAFLLFQAR